MYCRCIKPPSDLIKYDSSIRNMRQLYQTCVKNDKSDRIMLFRMSGILASAVGRFPGVDGSGLERYAEIVEYLAVCFVENVRRFNMP
jgi:hypothetical protein